MILPASFRTRTISEAPWSNDLDDGGASPNARAEFQYSKKSMDSRFLTMTRWLAVGAFAVPLGCSHPATGKTEAATGNGRSVADAGKSDANADAGKSDANADAGETMSCDETWLNSRFPSLHYLGLPANPDLSFGKYSIEPAFKNITFENPTMMLPMPASNYLFVAQREGKLLAFENTPDVTEVIEVLDLSSSTQGGNDSGLLGFVFHPNFGKLGSTGEKSIFVQYAHIEEPVPFIKDPITGKFPVDTETYARVSRFAFRI